MGEMGGKLLETRQNAEDAGKHAAYRSGVTDVSTSRG